MRWPLHYCSIVKDIGGYLSNGEYDVYRDEYPNGREDLIKMLEKIKVFNFMGKMIIDELSIPHKMALKALKKIMSDKQNPTEMEKLLISLCEKSGDFSDRNQIKELVEYIK